MIERTWQPYAQWFKIKRVYGGFSEKHYQEVEANNRLLYEAFARYLADEKGLSDKTIQQHLKKVQIVGNLLMDYGRTFFNGIDQLVMEVVERVEKHFGKPNTYRRSLILLYEFARDAQEITAEVCQDYCEQIQDCFISFDF